jgi:hypothetical protein
MFAPVIVYAELLPEENTAAAFEQRKIADAAASAPPPPVRLDETAARAFLGALGFPVGLQSALIDGLARTPARFFLLDDSGSMTTNDGMRVIDHCSDDYHNKSWAKCSRWDELADMARFHVQLAREAKAPTEFRYLNSLPPTRIGFGGGGSSSDGVDLGVNDMAVARLLGVLDDSGAPSAGTPLCRHIGEVIAQIRVLAPQLRASGQKAAVIIATDGEASDGDLRSALAPLKDLPATLTLRLCTNDQRVIDYWNQVDADLELNMDVLDDFYGEAIEVCTHNPWLNYGEPLHRLRESGLGIQILDAIDERALAPNEVHRVAQMIYATELPLPQADPAAFKRALAAVPIERVWDPTDSTFLPWIDVLALDVAIAVTTAPTQASLPHLDVPRRTRRSCCSSSFFCWWW